MKKVLIAVTLVLSVLIIQACNDKGGSKSIALICGDILTDTSKTLSATDDALDCDGTAVTLEDGVRLDLNGHTVSCDGGVGSIGILLSGQGATVENGTVTNCATGIYAADDGSHTVRNMSAVSNIGSEEVLLNGGVVIDSDNNTIRDISVTGNFPVGLVLYGDDNVVRDCNVSNNLHSGLAILSNTNEVSDCTINDNDYVNLGIVSVIENELTDRGNDNMVTNVTANRNINHSGMYIGGDFNTITNSTADENEVSGIAVGPEGENNSIVDNSAFNNNQSAESGDDRGGTDLFQTDADNCDNTWLDNFYGTSNSDCIQ